MEIGATKTVQKRQEILLLYFAGIFAGADTAIFQNGWGNDCD